MNEIPKSHGRNDFNSTSVLVVELRLYLPSTSLCFPCACSCTVRRIMDCQFLRFTLFRSFVCLSFPLMRTAARARATLCCRRPNNAKCGASANAHDTGERENYEERSTRKPSVVPTVERKKETVRKETEGRKKAKSTTRCQTRVSTLPCYFAAFAYSTFLMALCTLTSSPISYCLFTKPIESIRLFTRQSQSFSLFLSLSLSLSLPHPLSFSLSLSLSVSLAFFTFVRTFHLVNQDDSDRVSTRPFCSPVSPSPLALSRVSDFR